MSFFIKYDCNQGFKDRKGPISGPVQGPWIPGLYILNHPKYKEFCCFSKTFESKVLDNELFDTPVPVNNEDSLHLWFYLPPMPSDQASNLLAIPSYLIGHEGEGSILNLLKQEGLATELLIGSFLGTKLKSRVEIVIRLTKDGLKNWQRVYQVIFSYVKMSQEMSQQELQRIYQEVKSIHEATWQCLEEKAASHNVLG